MTRQTKTPLQRAEETLAAAQRRVVRARERRDTAKGTLADLELDLLEAERRLRYAEADPALPQQVAGPPGEDPQEDDQP